MRPAESAQGRPGVIADAERIPRFHQRRIHDCQGLGSDVALAANRGQLLLGILFAALHRIRFRFELHRLQDIAETLGGVCRPLGFLVELSCLGPKLIRGRHSALPSPRSVVRIT
jgi:hypothetical protein